MKKHLTLFCFLFLGIFGLSAKTVTYTIASKTDVLAEGDEPIGSMVTYEQSSPTGKNGQMTAGNSTTFTLTGLANITLYKIVLQMHSNSTSGAGELQIMVGNNELGYMPDTSFKQWWGEYTTTDVPITWDDEAGYFFAPTSEGGDGTTLQIHIQASENSLYISSYTLTYSDTPRRASTVYFHTATDETPPSLTEQAIGEGVLLPAGKDIGNEWFFKGWTTAKITHTVNPDPLPICYPAGSIFYPLEDTWLYALYVNYITTETVDWVQDTTFQSGDYLITDATFNKMAQGGVEEKRIQAADLIFDEPNEEGLYTFPIDAYPSSCVYHIDFLSNNMATIKHVESDTWVTYGSAAGSYDLRNYEEAWNYRITEKKQVRFYHAYKSSTREFLVGYDSRAVIYWLNTTYSRLPDANVLFNIADYTPADDSPITYTSDPLGTKNADVVAESLKINSVGIYNPTHQALAIYTLMGQCILQTNGDVLFATLPAGILLLRTPTQVLKFRVP